MPRNTSGVTPGASPGAWADVAIAHDLCCVTLPPLRPPSACLHLQMRRKRLAAQHRSIDGGSDCHGGSGLASLRVQFATPRAVLLLARMSKPSV